MVVCAYANDRKVVPIHPFHGTHPFIPSQERSCYNGCIINYDRDLVPIILLRLFVSLTEEPHLVHLGTIIRLIKLKIEEMAVIKWLFSKGIEEVKYDLGNDELQYLEWKCAFLFLNMEFSFPVWIYVSQ